MHRDDPRIPTIYVLNLLRCKKTFNRRKAASAAKERSTSERDQMNAFKSNDGNEEQYVYLARCKVETFHFKLDYLCFFLIYESLIIYSSFPAFHDNPGVLKPIISTIAFYIFYKLIKYFF